MTLAMLLSLVLPISVKNVNAAAESFTPDENKYYAITDSSGNAFKMRKVGTTSREDSVHADGVIENGKVIGISAFRIRKNADGKYSFQCNAASNQFLKCEKDYPFIFSWGDKAVDNNYWFELISKENNKYILKAQREGNTYYFAVGEDKAIEKVDSEDKATLFSISEVSVINTSVTI